MAALCNQNGHWQRCKTKSHVPCFAWSYFHKLLRAGSAACQEFSGDHTQYYCAGSHLQWFSGAAHFSKTLFCPDNGYDGHNWRDDFQPTPAQAGWCASYKTGWQYLLTNIHRVYAGNETIPRRRMRTAAIISWAKASGRHDGIPKVDLGMIVRDIDELMITNDEAHHIHDASLCLSKSIEDIHNQLYRKTARSACNWMSQQRPNITMALIFVQTVADYPLVEAIYQDVVKHPVPPDKFSRDKLQEKQSRQIYGEICGLPWPWRHWMAQGIWKLRKSRQKAILFCHDGRHPQLRWCGRNIWKRLIQTLKDGVL